MQRPWSCAADLSALHGLLNLLPYRTQDHRELGPPPSITKKILPSRLFWRHFLIRDSPPFEVTPSLCQVDIKPAQRSLCEVSPTAEKILRNGIGARPYDSIMHVLRRFHVLERLYPIVEIMRSDGLSMRWGLWHVISPGVTALHMN